MALFSSWDGTSTMAVCHVPKAMGTWLRKELLGCLGPERLSRPVATFTGTELDGAIASEIRARGIMAYCLIEGHFGLSSENAALLHGAYFVTCVREPKAMLLSHMNYAASQLRTPEFRKYMDPSRSTQSLFEEHYCARTFLFDNVLTRYLAGFSPERLLTEAEGREMVDRAAENFRELVDFAFLDCWLDESCQLFLDRTGLQVNPSIKANVSSPMAWCFSSRLFPAIGDSLVAEKTRFDVELYARCRQMFVNSAREAARLYFYVH